MPWSKRTSKRSRSELWRRVGHAAVAAGVISLGAQLTGCGGGEPAERPVGLERTIRDIEWSEVFAIRGSLQDTVFHGSGTIAADAGGVSVLDYNRQQVLRFRPDGTRAWTYGGPGEGPDEFGNAMRIQMDVRGRTWVLDVGNGRITAVDSTGRVTVRTPLGEIGAVLNGVVALGPERAIVGSLAADEALVVVDGAGRVVEEFRFPGREFRELEPISDQFEMAADPTSGRWVAAFNMRDRFVAFDGRTPMDYTGWFVEEIPPPEVIYERTEGGGRSVSLGEFTASVIDITLSPERLYVLFAGRSPDRGRVVDTYDMNTGAYVESFLVPPGAYELAYGGGTLYLAYADPYPTLIGLRPAEGSLR